MGQVKVDPKTKGAKRPWPLWLRILECIPGVNIIVFLVYIIVGFCIMVIDPEMPMPWRDDDD